METFTEIDITDCDLSWKDPARALDGHLWAKAFWCLSMPIILAFGTFFYIGPAFFESQGGDPQKRGLTNQLLSQILTLNLVNYWVYIPVRSYELLVGPVKGFVFEIYIGVNFVRYLCLTYYGMQVCLFKYMTIVVRKRMLHIVDDFCATFLLLSNCVIALQFHLTARFANEYLLHKTVMSGLPKDMAPYSDVAPWWNDVTLLVTIMFMGFTTGRIMIEKRKPDAPVDRAKALNFNSTAYNQEVTTNKTAVALGLLGITAGIVVEIYEQTLPVLTVSMDILTGMVFFPVVIAWGNKNLQQFILEFYGLR